MAGSLLVVHVHVRAEARGRGGLPRGVARQRPQASRREPGVVRFDLLASREDPDRFVLVEIYRDAVAAAAHKETAHYTAWRDAVSDLMAEPRRSTKYVNLSPEDAGW